MLNNKPENYIGLALVQANKSKGNGDVPVGAIIVCGSKIIAKAYNKKHKKQNCLFHAEILAINKACRKLKNFRLDDCDIYVTKEPCLMCMGAILSARIKTIYYGCSDKRFENINLATNNNFNHKCETVGGILEEECSDILSDFFKELRNKKETE